MLKQAIYIKVYKEQLTNILSDEDHFFLFVHSEEVVYVATIFKDNGIEYEIL